MAETQQISSMLAAATPKKLSSRHSMPRSAVAIVLDGNLFEQASVLLIQRAVSEGDPWSGHMAFPGGRGEKTDQNGVATAKREMLEEVGFDIDLPSIEGTPGQCIGRLSDIDLSKRVFPRKMVVSPYVFLIDSRPKLKINYEVADTVWIPLNYFADRKNRGIKAVQRDGMQLEFPCYHYAENQSVWGMTLGMLDELLAFLERPA